jgi:hypothetical protein
MAIQIIAIVALVLARAVDTTPMVINASIVKMAM